MSDWWKPRYMTFRCHGCGWLFACPEVQQDRTKCRACESKAEPITLVFTDPVYDDALMHGDET